MKINIIIHGNPFFTQINKYICQTEANQSARALLDLTEKVI